METLPGSPTPPPPGGDALEATIAATKAKLDADIKKMPAPPPPPGDPALPEPAIGAGAAPAAPAPAPKIDEGVALDITAESVSDFYGGLFSMIASRPGLEHWELTDSEKENLGKSTKSVLDKYGLRISAEVALMLALGMAIGPRWYMTNQIAAAEKAAKEKAAKEPPAPEKKPEPKPAPAPEKAQPAPEKPEKTGWAADDKDNGHH